MNEYVVTDTELTSIANAIRTKGGTQAQLEFPSEFVSAIEAIPTSDSPSLPSTYQEVEYLQTSGTQYCDIDFIIDTNDEISVTSMLLQNAGEAGFAGVYTTGNPNRFWELYYIIGSDGLCAYPKNDNYAYKLQSISGEDPNAVINTKYTLVAKFAKVPTNKVANFLIGRYRTDLYPFTGRLYEVKIKRNSINVLHLIPCYRISDNVAGFFDLIRQTFYVNKGSGSFVVGADVN